MSASDSSIHKELQPSQVRNSENDAKKVVEAFNNFTKPFHTEIMDGVFCLSSGKPAPTDVRTDLLRADECGRAAMETFIKERPVDIHEPIKRMKLKTFASTSLVKNVKSSDNKLVQIKAERNIFGQLVMLSVEHNIDLQVTLSYPLGIVPFSLATADGMPTKTNKAKIIANNGSWH